MKIKICIANYGERQLHLLNKILQELATFTKYSLDITIYTTVNIEGYACKLFDVNIGGDLTYTCREDMVKDIENYDLFLYNENDNLITEENIDAFVEMQKTLPLNFVAGFLRYELLENKKILIDVGPHNFWAPTIKQHYENYFSSGNEHQGCYLLTKEQLKHCVNSGEFLHKTGRGPYGVLEQGASDPYNRCGLIKVYPKNKETLKRHLIWHTSQKYYNHPNWSHNCITIDELV